MLVEQLSKILLVAAASSVFLGCPSLANEDSKGLYFTGSAGGSKIGDIDVQGVSSNIEFDADI